jgi:hypothetical protein
MNIHTWDLMSFIITMEIFMWKLQYQMITKYGTGNLVNADDVFTEKHLQLLKRAIATDSIVDIITQEDIAKKNICKKISIIPGI